MNYSKSIFLINKNARAIHATYEAGETASKALFKTLDATIMVDDFIIVPTNTRHNLTVCKVVDTDVDFDFDGTEKVEWVIGKVDLTGYNEMLKHEQVAIKAIKNAETRKKRDELREALLADHLDTIKALPITALNGEVSKG